MITINDINAIYNGSITVNPFTYRNTKMDVSCECPTHGSFTRRIDRLMEGRGCPQCGLAKAAAQRRFSHADIRAVIDSKYEIVSIEGDMLSTAQVVLRCPTHGIRPAKTAQYLRYYPCAECGYIECGEYSRLSRDEVINRFTKTHGEVYDYSEVSYEGKNQNDKVSIICRTHGSFTQSSQNHWNGEGCPLCAVSGFKYNKPTQLYVYHLTNAQGVEFIGFGISNIAPTRHQQHRLTFRNENVKGQLLHTFEFPDGHSAYACEQSLKLLGNVNSNITGFLTEALPNVTLMPAVVAMVQAALSKNVQ